MVAHLGLQQIPIRVLAKRGSHKDGIFSPSRGSMLPFVVHTWQSLSLLLSDHPSYSPHKCKHRVRLVSAAKRSIICANFQTISSYTLYRNTSHSEQLPETCRWLLKQGSKMFLAAKWIQFRKAFDDLKGLKFLRFDPWVKTETLAGKMETGLIQRKNSQVWFCFECETFISSSTPNKGKRLATQWIGVLHLWHLVTNSIFSSQSEKKKKKKKSKTVKLFLTTERTCTLRYLLDIF